MLKLKIYVCLLFLVFRSSIFCLEYKFEGIFKEPDGDERLFLTTFYLPYNPSVVVYSSDPILASQCSRWWPKASYSLNDPGDLGNIQTCDFVWIDSEDSELQILESIETELNHIAVIYTKTHFANSKSQYSEIRNLLEKNNFGLLSHWYWEGLEGNAIFVRRDLLDAAMRSLHYAPYGFNPSLMPSSYGLERFLKKVENKSKRHSIENIDYIYMINLDERPEKFVQATQGLRSFGIYPHRFSAVNGWKLPIETLQEVGVKFPSSGTEEKFMGSTYKQIEGNEYQSNEIIKGNGETYFSLGMSRGAIGIVLSHLTVLQDAYDSGYHTIWVMEDDVEVVGDVTQIPKLIKKLDDLVGDWDVLFTDIDTKDKNGNHVPCRATAARPNFNIEPLSVFFNRFYQLDQNFSRIGMRYGTYSMIVRRSGMKKILDHFNSYGVFLPYDMDFWLNPDVNMYSVTWDIVSHRAGALTDNNRPNYMETTGP